MTFVCRRKRSHSNYASHQVFSGLLTTLNLFNNDLHSEGGMAIAETLKVNRVLKNLNISSNNIGGYYDDDGDFVSTPEGPAAIADMLKLNAVLTDLKLGRNYIGRDGALALTEALKVNAVLTDLDLYNNNNICNEGAIAIAHALKSGNAVLKKLDVQRNGNISDEGKKVLWDAVRGKAGFELKVD